MTVWSHAIGWFHKDSQRQVFIHDSSGAHMVIHDKDEGLVERPQTEQELQAALDKLHDEICAHQQVGDLVMDIDKIHDLKKEHQLLNRKLEELRACPFKVGEIWFDPLCNRAFVMHSELSIEYLAVGDAVRVMGLTNRAELAERGVFKLCDSLEKWEQKKATLTEFILKRIEADKALREAVK